MALVRDDPEAQEALSRHELQKSMTTHEMMAAIAELAEAHLALMARMVPLLERIATALELQTMAYVKQVESASAAREASGVGRRGRSA